MQRDEKSRRGRAGQRNLFNVILKQAARNETHPHASSSRRHARWSSVRCVEYIRMTRKRYEITIHMYIHTCKRV